MSKDYELLKVITERNSAARKAEENDDFNGAIKLYEQNIKENHADQYAYDRLMIIYRKLKKYRDELRVIRRGIQVFSQQRAAQLKQALSDRKNKKKVLELSNVFMTKSGLKDKKGNSTYQPQPLNKWTKRMELVEKKSAGSKPKKKG